MRRRVETELVGHRRLWPRVIGLVLLGAFLLFVVYLPALASDNNQWSPSLTWYVLLAVILAGLMSRTYVLVRLSAASRWRAVLVAFAVIPGSYCAAVLFYLLIVTLL